MTKTAGFSWQRLLGKDPKLVLGLMSGTSADGVDVAVVEIRGVGADATFRLQHFGTVAYPRSVREAVLAVAQAEAVRLADVARLNMRLGELFAEAAEQVVERAGLRLSEVDLIGSHGQTIGHFPEPANFLGNQTRATVQIAEPAVIAKRTGVPTVADFRVSDLAVGGEGAPLVPYFDWLALRHLNRNVVALNIGGIANVTVLPKGASLEQVLASDTGPGNAMIDTLTEIYWGEPMDAGGRHASQGRIDNEWLDRLMREAYFHRVPPKSTGRETFGRAFAKRLAEEAPRRGLYPEDVLATVTAFTARSVAEAINDFVLPRMAVDEILVSGGGARNPFLLHM
ncbi:MAG TPA: anhydro-N-acetylmuramic acid kinase, partial [Bacteroidetes bacterium]|nr:anhydro-N-acetylmuramic acid kinase [Bacteroidota bacterium]